MYIYQMMSSNIFHIIFFIKSLLNCFLWYALQIIIFRKWWLIVMAGKLQRDLILDKIRGLGLASGCTIGDDSIKCLLCNISFSDISQDKNFPIKALSHFGSLKHFNAENGGCWKHSRTKGSRRSRWGCVLCPIWSSTQYI